LPNLMLARRFVLSPMSEVHGAQKVRWPGEQCL
jgi:hypothetical protein